VDGLYLRRGTLVDVFQKIDELDGAFATVAFCQNFPRACIKGSEKIRSPATGVLVLELDRPTRDCRLGLKCSSSRLQLGLFILAEYNFIIRQLSRV